MIMAKWLSLLVLLGLMASPVSTAATSPAENIVSYRLLLADGQVIAYTEAVPHVGDYYWQADADKWYHVVRVEGDVGWLEPTAPPGENGRAVTPPPVIWVTLVWFFTAIVCFLMVGRRAA